MLQPVPIHNLVNVTHIYTVYNFKKNKDYKFAGESHNFWEILYLSKGKLIGLNGTEIYNLEAGELILHRPNVFHSMGGNGTDDFEVMIISFQCDTEFFDNDIEYIFPLNYIEKNTMEAIFEEGYLVHHKPIGKNYFYPEKGGDPGSEDRIASKQMVRLYLEQLLIHLCRKGIETSSQLQKFSMQSLSTEHRVVKDILVFLEKNIYNNVNFNLIVQQFYMSKTSLKKIFKEVTGHSVMEYYRAMITEKIKHYIEQDEKSFTEISSLFHFSSIHYFSKFFKRETGKTPSEYQNMFKTIFK
jgi:AraC-like DNA-binding protein